MVMTYSHAKVQDRWSVGSEDRVETNRQTNGWTEATALPTALMWSVTKSSIVKACILRQQILSLDQPAESK